MVRNIGLNLGKEREGLGRCSIAVDLTIDRKTAVAPGVQWSFTRAPL
jgi:hypothetical protein